MLGIVFQCLQETLLRIVVLLLNDHCQWTALSIAVVVVGFLLLLRMHPTFVHAQRLDSHSGLVLLKHCCLRNLPIDPTCTSVAARLGDGGLLLLWLWKKEGKA